MHASDAIRRLRVGTVESHAHFRQPVHRLSRVGQKETPELLVVAGFNLGWRKPCCVFGMVVRIVDNPG